MCNNVDVQLDILSRRSHSYLLTTSPHFSNPVSNPYRKPWQAVFVRDLSQLIRPTANRVNKERYSAMPVMNDFCFRPRIWLIVIFSDKKGHFRPDRAFAIWKGIIVPIERLRPKKGMLGPKVRSSPARASWPERTSSSWKENFFSKGHLRPERVFVVQKGIRV